MIVLKIKVPQMFSKNYKEQEFEVTPEMIVSYGIDGEGKYYVEVIDDDWDEKERFELSFSGLMWLMSAMEEYYGEDCEKFSTEGDLDND